MVLIRKEAFSEHGVRHGCLPVRGDRVSVRTATEASAI